MRNLPSKVGPEVKVTFLLNGKMGGRLDRIEKKRKRERRCCCRGEWGGGGEGGGGGVGGRRDEC